MMLRTLKNLELSGKIVLVRADLNVPIGNGQILDGTRIDRFLPTLQMLLENRAKVVIITHLGRPKGTFQQGLSLTPLAKYLEKKLEGVKVPCVSLEEATSIVKQALNPGDCLLLENIRFYPEEEENDSKFAKNLAALGDIFVNDAFAVSHRAHASVEAITHCIPSYAGPQLEQEIIALTKAFTNPQKPVMAILAGAKVSTKIILLQNLSQKVDTLIIAGGLAHTFLAAQGYQTGKDSLCEESMIPLAQKILDTSLAEIILPIDVKMASAVSTGEEVENFSLAAIPSNKIIVDMGEKTLEMVQAKLTHMKTLIWNGVVGIFELRPFDQATIALAHHVAELTKSKSLFSVAGGGETIAGLNKAGVLGSLSYVSAAGGAFLEFLEGKSLPGILPLFKH